VICNRGLLSTSPLQPGSGIVVQTVGTVQYAFLSQLTRLYNIRHTPPDLSEAHCLFPGLETGFQAYSIRKRSIHSQTRAIYYIYCAGSVAVNNMA
jgi:hypothetical protein